MSIAGLPSRIPSEPSSEPKPKLLKAEATKVAA
jgi:hypothetical protein